jgi:hypothetical protein
MTAAMLSPFASKASGLIVDHLSHDLSAEKAARSVPLVDCKVDHLAHLDADANLLVAERSRADGDRRGSQRRGDHRDEFGHSNLPYQF